MSELGTLLNFSGKTALVTGGGKGAGVAIARQFAKAGANVAITYSRSKDPAMQTVEELRALGVKAEAFRFDQSRTEEIPTLLDTVTEHFGSLDVLVNNAGIYPAKMVMDITAEDWDDMMDCNARGVFFLCKEAAKRMGACGGGAIVNISSINADNPSDRLIHYGASKAAVEMLTKGLAHSFGELGVRVNCVAPGLIWAEGQEKNIPGWRESYCERAPLSRLVEAEDIGNACVFLASPLASAVTGQTLTVDCGVLLAPCFDNRC
ncbi:MAG: glucose 1-dehydrogenase [Oscillospiraceae bacterium]|nr:glucose 1-dehydrogenase [Oscillospiraceae bacterium]